MDDDRLLVLVGVALVGLLVAVGGVAVLAAVEPPARNGPPVAEWSFERVNDTHVRVEHAGGAPVEASNLMLTVDGYRRRPGWSGRLEKGDGAVVPANEGQLVRLYWTDGSDRALLARWRVGSE